ncbi:MAG: hypothetical protein JRJ43_09770 [Deltaproteobacteria bacterium]|nr:hypothetical protein [Deltaproteobacteria bacterium]MBW1719831.1 hypothetical protein [Deltaproteobacteria bacterium]MBW1939251.1 hypothetical protein [Deltaproteobacteria bacterium]MBW1963977.1 hypothetical protein [Deltaproteobacteria bacterium]
MEKCCFAGPRFTRQKNIAAGILDKVVGELQFMVYEGHSFFGYACCTDITDRTNPNSVVQECASFGNALKFTDGIKSKLGESLLNPLREEVPGHAQYQSPIWRKRVTCSFLSMAAGPLHL